MALSDRVALPGLCATTEDLALAVQTLVEEAVPDVPTIPCSVLGKVYAKTSGDGVGILYVTESDPQTCVDIPFESTPVASTLVGGLAAEYISVADTGLVQLAGPGDPVEFTNRTGKAIFTGATVIVDDGAEFIVGGETPTFLQGTATGDAPEDLADFNNWYARTYSQINVSDSSVTDSGALVVDHYGILPSVGNGGAVLFSVYVTELGAAPRLTPVNSDLTSRNLEKLTWLCARDYEEGEVPEQILGRNSGTCDPKWYDYLPGDPGGPDPDPPEPPPVPDPGDENWYTYIYNIINNYYEYYGGPCCDDEYYEGSGYPPWFMAWLTNFMQRFVEQKVVTDIESIDLELKDDKLQAEIEFKTVLAKLLDAAEEEDDDADGLKVDVVECPPPPEDP